MNKLYPQFSIKGVVTFVSSKLASLDYTAILTYPNDENRGKKREGWREEGFQTSGQLESSSLGSALCGRKGLGPTQ